MTWSWPKVPDQTVTLRLSGRAVPDPDSAVEEDSSGRVAERMKSWVGRRRGD
jgi:hypothetical protein